MIQLKVDCSSVHGTLIHVDMIVFDFLNFKYKNAYKIWLFAILAEYQDSSIKQTYIFEFQLYN